MHRDRDLGLDVDLPPGAEAVTADLELDTLLAALAARDRFLLDTTWYHSGWVRPGQLPRGAR
jgi:hypothetical protein